MYISLEGLIIPLFFPEKSDNEIILPINLRPASQNWDAGLKNQMRGSDNNKYLLHNNLTNKEKFVYDLNKY